MIPFLSFHCQSPLKLIRQFETLGRALLQVPDLKFRKSTGGEWVLKLEDTPLGGDFVGSQLEALRLLIRFQPDLVLTDMFHGLFFLTKINT